MSQATEKDQILSDMQLALAKDLLNRVKSGEATAAELNVARQMLKDNAVQAPKGTNKPLEQLTQYLPAFPDERPA